MKLASAQVCPAPSARLVGHNATALLPPPLTKFARAYLPLVPLWFMKPSLMLKDTEMIRLNCFIRVAADSRAEVVALATRLVEASLADKGCVAYDLFESATRPDVLMICETWADQASLDAHSAATHFTEIVPQIRSLAEMKLEKFDF